MKTLEQLGISPTPWKKADDGMGYKDIWCNAPVTEDSEGENIIAEAIDAKDAHLIAAAPELYEALRMYQEAFAKIRKSAWFLDANFHEIMSLNKVMTAADAALAKAAGESETISQPDRGARRNAETTESIDPTHSAVRKG